MGIMKIIITRQDLINAGDCGMGREILDDFGLDQIEFYWSKAAQGFVLGNSIGKQWMTWLVNKGLLPLWSFCKADLKQVDLREADLREAILWGANLWGANLWEANLWEANLKNIKKNTFTKGL